MHLQSKVCDLGTTFQNENVIAFFGNKNATLASIQNHFPDLKFYRIKQTHSDICVKASSEVAEADAHWTEEKNKALVIATADCTPLMIYDSKNSKVAAIHAGWKGVANQITLKSIQTLGLNKADASSVYIWSGPHILQNSFEVQEDVLQQLLNSSFNLNKDIHFQKTETGYLVNLDSILKSQVNSCLTDFKNFESLLIDTKTDLLFHSFRRDKSEAGRNLSFIALL